MAKITIMLDPGHDYANYNQSPAVKSYYEGARMWRLYQLLRAALEARGITVKGTKSQVNQAIDVVARGRMAKGCTALVSLHSNACDTESVDRPVGIYFVDDDCGKIDDTSKALAVLLSNTVANVMETRGKAQQYSRQAGGDRDGDGKKNDDYYGVLYGAHQVGVPAIILENSFHTNARAASWLLSDANLQRLADALADDLAKHFGVQPATPAEPEPVHWYRVRKTWEDEDSQLGAFLKLEHAKTACPAGYSVYDWEGRVIYSKPAKTEPQVDPARDFSKSKAGVYKVDTAAGLNLRAGASMADPVLEAMPDGSRVRCYGYHTGVWLYVVSASGKIGFCHSDYLEKV